MTFSSLYSKVFLEIYRRFSVSAKFAAGVETACESQNELFHQMSSFEAFEALYAWQSAYPKRILDGTEQNDFLEKEPQLLSYRDYESLATQRRFQHDTLRASE